MREALELRRRLLGRPEDERVEAELAGEARKGLHPVLRRAVEQAARGAVGDPAADVVEPADLGRLATFGGGSLVDVPLHVWNVVRRRSAGGRDPPVGEAAGQLERTRLADADPDRDRMLRSRPW